MRRLYNPSLSINAEATDDGLYAAVCVEIYCENGNGSVELVFENPVVMKNALEAMEQVGYAFDILQEQGYDAIERILNEQSDETTRFIEGEINDY